jgi:hypothetical protein
MKYFSLIAIFMHVAFPNKVETFFIFVEVSFDIYFPKRRTTFRVGPHFPLVSPHISYEFENMPILK